MRFVKKPISDFFASMKKYYDQFRLNKLFHGTMKSYFMIACMVFAAYAAVLIVSVANASLTQITTAQNKMLSQAETSNDFLLRSLTAAATEALESSGVAMSAMTEPYSVERSRRVAELVDSMKAGASAIDKVYFFNFKDDIIYTGDAPACGSADFPDRKLIGMINAAGRYTMNVPHRLKYIDGINEAEKDTLVSLYKYSDTACMAVFIDCAFYNSMINADLSDPDQGMIVLNNSDTVISSTEKELFGTSMADSPILKKIRNRGGKDGHFLRGGTFYCYRCSDTLNSVYICTITLSSILVSFGWQIAILLLFAMLLVLLYFVSSIKLSMSIFRPFRKLRTDVFEILGLTGGSETDSGTDSDLKLIADNLISIRERYDSMHENEIMYSEAKRGELVYNIITGAYNYDEEDIKEYDIDLSYPHCTVMLVRLDNTKKIDRSDIGLALYGIANAGEELFTGSDMRAYNTTYGEEYDIVFLINHVSSVFDALRAKMLQKYAKNMFDISISAAVCTGGSDIDSVSEMYRNAKYAMQYRLVAGHGAVIEYDKLIGGVSHDTEYPSKLEKAVLREINLRNRGKTEAAVDNFLEHIASMPYVYIIVHSCVLIMAVIAHMKTDSRIEDYNGDIITDELTKAETLDDIKNAVMAKCSDAIISSSDVRIDDKYMMIANSIKDFIDKNYTDPNLSIDIIASHVNKSANYTRSIFKQNKGISISEYIQQCRFNEVCRLLRETNLTAQQISKLTGMSSSSYFYTAFKKYTGYTLEQYRKKHMHTG